MSSAVVSRPACIIYDPFVVQYPPHNQLDQFLSFVHTLFVFVLIKKKNVSLDLGTACLSRDRCFWVKRCHHCDYDFL